MKQNIIALSIVILSIHGFANTDADNTKINKRDRASDELTADQQAYNTSDTSITRRIRQDIMADTNLSTNAQNIKIISVNGKVTLKGAVQTAQEQTSIMEYARRVAGAPNVINEISVVADN